MSSFIKAQFNNITLTSMQQAFRYMAASPENQKHANTPSNSGDIFSFDAKGHLTQQNVEGRCGMIFDETGRKIHQWAPHLRCI